MGTLLVLGCLRPERLDQVQGLPDPHLLRFHLHHLSPEAHQIRPAQVVQHLPIKQSSPAEAHPYRCGQAAQPWLQDCYADLID